MKNCRKCISNISSKVTEKHAYKKLILQYIWLIIALLCRWCLFQHPIIDDPKNVVIFSKATIALHNYLRTGCVYAHLVMSMGKMVLEIQFLGFGEMRIWVVDYYQLETLHYKDDFVIWTKRHWLWLWTSINKCSLNIIMTKVFLWQLQAILLCRHSLLIYHVSYPHYIVNIT